MAKKIVAGKKVESLGKRIFTVPPGGRGEQAVVLQFDKPVTYQVVKLEVKGLPATWKGKKITWLNRWGVMSKAGKYVGSVRYTVFVPRSRRKDAQFVYKDDKGLHADKTPMYEGKRRGRTGMVQVEFNRGDPGVGYT